MESTVPLLQSEGERLFQKHFDRKKFHRRSIRDLRAGSSRDLSQKRFKIIIIIIIIIIINHYTLIHSFRDLHAGSSRDLSQKRLTIFITIINHYTLIHSFHDLRAGSSRNLSQKGFTRSVSARLYSFYMHCIDLFHSLIYSLIH